MEFPPAAVRTAHALSVNVEAAVTRWGLSRTGFLTLTFADHVLDPVEAQRRMNSLTTNVLRPRYGECIRVLERQKSGRIHYHILVRLGADIRTGVDFAAFDRRDYRSAPLALRTEWAFWRTTAKAYKFGRTEMLPILSSAGAVATYVGKYISKHFRVRDMSDHGVRLVSYVGPRVATVKFAWAGGQGKAWRAGLGRLIDDLYRSRQIHRPTMDAMARSYGKSWAWHWRDVVRDRARGDLDVDYETGECREASGHVAASVPSARPGGRPGAVRSGGPGADQG